MRPARACDQTHLSVDAEALGSLWAVNQLSASRVGRRMWLVRRSELERMRGSRRPAGSDHSGAPMRPTMPGDRPIIDSGAERVLMVDARKWLARCASPIIAGRCA